MTTAFENWVNATAKHQIWGNNMRVMCQFGYKFHSMTAWRRRRKPKKITATMPNCQLTLSHQQWQNQQFSWKLNLSIKWIRGMRKSLYVTWKKSPIEWWCRLSIVTTLLSRQWLSQQNDGYNKDNRPAWENIGVCNDFDCLFCRYCCNKNLSIVVLSQHKIL